MRVLVGTEDGLHVLADGMIEPTVQLPGHAVGSVAWDGERWWAIADGDGVWHSDGPGSWEMSAPATGRRLNCVAPTTAGLVVGTSEAGLCLLAGDRLVPVASFQDVEGRDEWHTPWGGPPDVRSISSHPDGAIYVNVHVGGVARSVDGGRTWVPTIDIHTDVHQVLAAAGRPGTVLAALGAAGLAISRDGAGSWERVTEGLPAAYCRAVALGEESVFVSASNGPRGGRAAVYRTPLDRPGSLVRCPVAGSEWLPGNVDTFCLAASGPVAAAGTEEGEVHLSTDHGATWRPVATGLPPVRCVVLDGSGAQAA